MSEPCPTCGHVDATVTFTEGQSELSKSITAHRPISEVTGRGRTVRRDFTLAEIEAVLVEFRAAGAWDEATVALRYDELTCEVILHPIELPRALPEPRLPDRGRGKPARRWLPGWSARLAMGLLLGSSLAAAIWPWVTR